MSFTPLYHVDKIKGRKILSLSGKKCYFVLNHVFYPNSLRMTGFLGEFESTLDPKGRFLLPAGVKKQLPNGENTRFVINRGFEKCLSLYTIESWEPLYSKIQTLNDFDPKVREFRRYFLNGATIVEPDSAGRILLPPNLKEYAGLEKDIVLASAVDKIEIWAKDKYQQFFDSYSPEDFSNLAKDVMVNDKES